MRFAAYVVLLFSISVMLWMFGYPSTIMYLYERSAEEATEPASLIYLMASKLLNSEAGIVLLGLTGLAIILATFLSGGFIAMFIVPMMIMMTVLNFLVFPLSFLFDAALPLEVRVIGIVFFNMLTVLATLSFVRGSV
jgi:hypothetical protein